MSPSTTSHGPRQYEHVDGRGDASIRRLRAGLPAPGCRRIRRGEPTTSRPAPAEFRPRAALEAPVTDDRGPGRSRLRRSTSTPGPDGLAAADPPRLAGRGRRGDHQRPANLPGYPVDERVDPIGRLAPDRSARGAGQLRRRARLRDGRGGTPSSSRRRDRLALPGPGRRGGRRRAGRRRSITMFPVTPPPAPPAHDTCDGALTLAAGPIGLADDLGNAATNEPRSRVASGTSGRWRHRPRRGLPVRWRRRARHLDVTMTGTGDWDEELYVVSRLRWTP